MGTVLYVRPVDAMQIVAYGVTKLCSSPDKASTYQGTGSRFQHAEKLQFAQEDEGAAQVEEASEEVRETPSHWLTIY